MRPYANLASRGPGVRRFTELTFLKHMAHHSGVQTLPPRSATAPSGPGEVAPGAGRLPASAAPQFAHPLQSRAPVPAGLAPAPNPLQQMLSSAAAPAPGQQQQPQQQQQPPAPVRPQQAAGPGPREAEEAGAGAYTFITSPREVRVPGAGHPLGVAGGPPLRQARTAAAPQVVAGVNLLNPRASQQVYFEFQSAVSSGEAASPVQQQPAAQQQQAAASVAAELQVGYPVIRGAGAGRGISVRAGQGLGPGPAPGPAVSGAAARRRAAQQVRAQAPAPAPPITSQPAPSQQQQTAAVPSSVASQQPRTSGHHVVVQQQTTQPQIIRRAASLSAAPAGAQQPGAGVQAVLPPGVHAQQQQLVPQQQQPAGAQRYVRLVGSAAAAAAPGDYPASLALAAGLGEADDDCQIIEMPAARPLSISQGPATAPGHPQRLGAGGQQLPAGAQVSQYQQMVHRVLPGPGAGVQASQAGQIFRRVAAPSQVVQRQVQQQQQAAAGPGAAPVTVQRQFTVRARAAPEVVGQAMAGEHPGVAAHVQFASGGAGGGAPGAAGPETLQARQQPHVVQVRQAQQQQQVVAGQAGAGMDTNMLRQRILQQRHEEQQQQQIRQQVLQQQQQLSLDSQLQQRQRPAVAVSSVGPSSFGEVYLQPRVAAGPSQLASGALRRPVVATAGAAGQSTRVLTSAQAGAAGGASYRTSGAVLPSPGGAELFVSSASEIGRQHSFQASAGAGDLQQQQVVDAADGALYSPEPILPSSSRQRIGPPSMLSATGGLTQQRLIVPTGGGNATTARRLVTAQYPAGVTVVPASALQQHQQQSGGQAAATQQVLITEEVSSTSGPGHRVLAQPGSTGVNRNASSIPTVVFVEPDLSGQGAAVQQFTTTMPQSAGRSAGQAGTMGQVAAQQLQGSIVVTGQPRVVTATAAGGALQNQAGVPAIRHRLVTHLQHRPTSSAAFAHQQPATQHM